MSGDLGGSSVLEGRWRDAGFRLQDSSRVWRYAASWITWIRYPSMPSAGCTLEYDARAGGERSSQYITGLGGGGGGGYFCTEWILTAKGPPGADAVNLKCGKI